MSTEHRKRIFNYRTASGKAPDPANIAYGEIAINYKGGSEAIYIKNSADEVVDFVRGSFESITYANLKTLRDKGKLVPSRYYRITDFVTTVANDPEAQSAGHPFDIIVLASDKDKLQEECYAIQHEGDTYFANCNLAAWKIWYCLDNDNTKYAWADTTNGKGVIYRMIDEWQNDCPYDFKNVQFKRYAVVDASPNGELADLDGTYIGYNSGMKGLNIPDQSNFKWMYTFSLPKDDEYVDYSSNGLYGPFTEDVGYFKLTKKGQCVYNTLSNTYGSVNIDGQFYVSLILNNIVLISNRDFLSDLTDNFPTEMVYNTFGTANFNMTLKDNPESNKFDNKCYNNIVGGYANTFGNGCYNNTFGNECNNNTFGVNFWSNTFGSNCSYNSFGDNCDNNTFGGYCRDNSFGNDCSGNTFGDSCNSNTFGYNCDSNTFGYECGGNSFGDSCNSNTFGNTCSSNSFGDNCDRNHFGNYCVKNTFGNYCDSNSFGDSCNSNTFGNTCSGNSFGNYCDSNTFGNNCGWNTFGNYFQYNALGNNILHIKIPTEKIYHTQVLNGTKGTKTNKLTIEFTPETAYSQFAGTAPDGTLMVWVPTSNTIEPVQGNKQYNDY